MVHGTQHFIKNINIHDSLSMGSSHELNCNHNEPITVMWSFSFHIEAIAIINANKIYLMEDFEGYSFHKS